MDILIKNGTVIDPESNLAKQGDVLIKNSIISEVGDVSESAERVIDAAGLWVCPGFIDLHTHLRDPGQTEKETIESGSKAAAAGGFTTICCMPNVNPVTDCAEAVKYINETAKKTAAVNVLPVGSITKGMIGAELSDIYGMAKEGICAISEDGKTVANSSLMSRALSIAKELNLPVFSHCEDVTLVNNGHINKGNASEKLLIHGISNESEEVIIARDIILANSAGVKIHICHISTAGGARILQEARVAGVQVTGEATPHHFTLSDKDIVRPDTNFKMNPPLRSEKDVEAIAEAVITGIIGVIATDHAPHDKKSKALPFEKAPFGIIGLETAFPLAYSAFIKTGRMSPINLIKRLTLTPANILGVKKGRLQPGFDADITIIDPNKTYKIDLEKSMSLSRNSPFDKTEVSGAVCMTIVRGKIVYNTGGK